MNSDSGGTDFAMRGRKLSTPDGGLRHLGIQIGILSYQTAISSYSNNNATALVGVLRNRYRTTLSGRSASASLNWLAPIRS